MGNLPQLFSLKVQLVCLHLALTLIEKQCPEDLQVEAQLKQIQVELCTWL